MSLSNIFDKKKQNICEKQGLSHLPFMNSIIDLDGGLSGFQGLVQAAKSL